MTKIVMPAACIAAIAILPALLISCATTSDGSAYRSVSLTAKSVDNMHGATRDGEIVATLEILNSSNRAVCLNRDVLINKLSPHVQVTRSNEKATSGLPHRPISTAIEQISPGERREFRRIVGYASSSTSQSRTYKVSVNLWDCETSERLVRHAKLEG